MDRCERSADSTPPKLRSVMLRFGPWSRSYA